MMEYKIGDVLWQMQGREQNGICKWRAVPHSIEVIDDRKILFENGCGGSLGNIGKTWFLSRQEALDDFLKKHNSLEIPLPELNAEEELQTTHLPRTDFQDLEVCKDNSVDTATVYTGHVDSLSNITDCLKWHSEYCEPLYMDIKTLTLSEIYEQVKRISNRGIITVFVDTPLHGDIYQCGNHQEGKWEKIGETRGYA